MYQRMLMACRLDLGAPTRGLIGRNPRIRPREMDDLVDRDEEDGREHDHDEHHPVVISVSRRVGQVTLAASAGRPG